MKISDGKVEHAARLHEQLQQYLLREHGAVPLLVIVTALTYEIGRIVGETMPDVDVRDTVDTIADTLTEQIRAYRAGRLRG